MMTSSYVLEVLHQHGYDFITGVPDSMFKDLIISVKEDDRFEHVITNNEGESCALAAGYYLATGKVPVVYMQNSGLGHCVNPLTSLLDEWIYAMPCLLLISWRGKPGEPDEPQHQRMGAILLDLLTLLDIPYAMLEPEKNELQAVLNGVQEHFRSHNKPFALIFTRQTLKTSPQMATSSNPPVRGLLREEVLEYLVTQRQAHHLFVTTTGKSSRELYEIRERLNQGHERDFLTVGSMGCASTLGLGIAMQRPEKKVMVIDGDGACLMRLEALATIGHVKPSNLLHVLIDNNAYESTGAQQTQSHHIDFAAIALACGYRYAITITDMKAWNNQAIDTLQGPTMVVIRTLPWSRENLGRPKTSALENKQVFMKHLGVSSCKPLS